MYKAASRLLLPRTARPIIITTPLPSSKAPSYTPPWTRLIGSNAFPPASAPSPSQDSPSSSESRQSSLNFLSGSLPPSTKLIKSVSNFGFQVGDLALKGGVIVLNNSVLMWDTLQYGIGSDVLVREEENKAKEMGAGKEVVDDPGSVFHGWTTDVFKVFEVVEPKPEILVIGTGGRLHQLPPFLKKYLNNLGMQTEVMATRHAGQTYSILLSEGRHAAVALLPNIPTSARTGKPLVKLTTRPE
ncbi:hypothetical protein HDV05_007125 [Chytridiales sp. JEL 0842]|nr:hypothetical protein HDV05_007125 [Chytridiales sp. JEL 0842]